MEMLFRHGEDLAMTGINSGDFSKLAAVIGDSLSDNAELRSSATLVATACVLQLARFIETARHEGYRFTPIPPTANELAYSAAGSPARFWNEALLVITAARELKRIEPSIQFSVPAPAVRTEEAAKPPAPDTPATEVEKITGPLEVRVVSLPPRVSDAMIERDSEGNIMSTKRIEKDF